MNTKTTQTGVEEKIAEFQRIVFLATQNATAKVFGFEMVSNEPIVEWLRNALKEAKEEGAREELDVLETWLWENGITHKESARNLMAFIKERQKLSNNT